MTPTSPPLSAVLGWGHPATAGWLPAGGSPQATGDIHRHFEWASVTKIVTAMAVWVAVEEGTVAWEEAAGPPGSTLEHLLSHTSGLAFDGPEVLAPPGRRRIYSNRGFEVAAEHLAGAARMEFSGYAREAVLEPLGMVSTEITGSAAAGAAGPLVDLLSLAAELLQPTLIARSTWERVTSVAFPGLPGVLPGFGRQADNSWGLGVEVRGRKRPHWTGQRNSPRTFGHFGRSGSFLWVDPVARIAAASLSAEPFGPWAARAWPALSDAIVEAATGS